MCVCLTQPKCSLFVTIHFVLKRKRKKKTILPRKKRKIVYTPIGFSLFCLLFWLTNHYQYRVSIMIFITTSVKVVKMITFSIFVTDSSEYFKIMFRQAFSLLQLFSSIKTTFFKILSL